MTVGALRGSLMASGKHLLEICQVVLRHFNGQNDQKCICWFACLFRGPWCPSAYSSAHLFNFSIVSGELFVLSADPESAKLVPTASKKREKVERFWLKIRICCTNWKNASLSFFAAAAAGLQKSPDITQSEPFVILDLARAGVLTFNAMLDRTSFYWWNYGWIGWFWNQVVHVDA